MSDDDRSYTAYWKYVHSLANDAIEAVLEDIEYDVEFQENIYEAVLEITDCVDWVIYSHHAIKLMQYTDNPDAFYEATGKTVPTAADNWCGLVVIMASYAIIADTLSCALRMYDAGTFGQPEPAAS